MSEEDDDTELIQDDTDFQDGMVEAVMIRRTPNDPSHPCGWKYGLHFGTVDADDPVVRYDNSHELSKGHERHIKDGVEIIDFLGMKERQERFDREVSEWRDEHQTNPHDTYRHGNLQQKG